MKLFKLEYALIKFKECTHVLCPQMLAFVNLNYLKGRHNPVARFCLGWDSPGDDRGDIEGQ